MKAKLKKFRYLKYSTLIPNSYMQNALDEQHYLWMNCKLYMYLETTVHHYIYMYNT